MLPKINLCSSSSPGQRVGNGGKSTVVVALPGLCESTRISRGLQKLRLVLEGFDCCAGDGEGEREGQELMDRRSEAWLAITEGGWMNTTDTTNY